MANIARTTGENHTADRWTENGDGTISDRLTQLTWEVKTDDGGIHDVGNTYTWSTGDPFSPSNFDGTAATVFLAQLNFIFHPPGQPGHCVGLAGFCDWRLPTIDELQAISEPGFPDCLSPPCTTIPGETVPSFYWSSSIFAGNPDKTWAVNFGNGGVSFGDQDIPSYVRAVRDGS